MQHVALEYDLTEALRPDLVVDLGAGDCVSFFAYCQSMSDHDIDGSCYAIDTWEDSVKTHPAATLDAINAHGRRYYSGLSYVVRMAPFEARRHFDDETIALLRIDGTRSDVVAGADVEAWYRRVQPGGVIVWHGPTGATSLWSLVAPRCQSAVLRKGRELGIALKPGRKKKNELFELLFGDGETSHLERFYAHARNHLSLRRVVEAMS
jgi:hypothetical protein